MCEIRFFEHEIERNIHYSCVLRDDDEDAFLYGDAGASTAQPVSEPVKQQSVDGECLLLL